MPFRGPYRFGWLAAEGNAAQLRALGAIALLLAGWGMGFLSGRLSAWVFPVEPATTAAQPAKPAPEAVPAASKSADTSTAKLQAETRALSPPAPPAEVNRSAGPVPAERPKSDAGDVQGPVDTPPDVNAPAPARILNPDNSTPDAVQRQAEAVSEPSDAPDLGSEEQIAACERRFASFRRSDGTYQPYGSRGRQLCPLLR